MRSMLSTYDLAFGGRHISPTCSNGGLTAFGSDALGLKEDRNEAVWRKKRGRWAGMSLLIFLPLHLVFLSISRSVQMPCTYPVTPIPDFPIRLVRLSFARANNPPRSQTPPLETCRFILKGHDSLRSHDLARKAGSRSSCVPPINQIRQLPVNKSITLSLLKST